MALNKNRAALGAVVLSALALGVTSCASDSSAPAGPSSSDSAIVKEAQGLVDDANPALEWKAPGPQFDATADLHGGRFTFISVALATQYSTALADGLSDAAKVFGASVDALEANGDPTTASRQVSAAVSSGSAGIVIQGFSSTLLAAPIKAAAQAGIPVVMVNDVEQSEPSAEQKALGVFGNATSCFSCGGKLMADMAIAKYGSSANSVFIGATSLGETAAKEQDAYESEIKRLCSDCEVKMLDIGVAKWATDIAPAVTSALSDRSVNVVAPLYDLEFPFALSAISAAQATDRVSVVSVDGTQPGLTDLAKGKPVLGDVGSSATQLGWTAFDQLLRAANDQEPATDSVLPMRAFTEDTAAGLDLSKGAEEGWFTDADLAGEFSQLWGQS